MILTSISIELGKGVLNHNNRKFIADNVDKSRTKDNIEYENISLENAYHHLFDEALKRYNDRQKRSDRKIKNYLEHIQKGKQEKPFYEIIVQVGNKSDMGVNTHNKDLSKTILDEYMKEFQKRNPNLYVFNAHLHMDEATPHLHIDFIPFTSNSKRGLDTRVSMKQALSSQGFKGGTREETEWSQWVNSEKHELSKVMLEHNVEWEYQSNHKEHLSVLDYKKQERTKEVAELERQCSVLKDSIVNLADCKEKIEDVFSEKEFDQTYALPEPNKFENAKSYKSRIEPIFSKLKEFAKRCLIKYFNYKNQYREASSKVQNLQIENHELKQLNTKYLKENLQLRKELKDFKTIKRFLGKEKLADILSQIKNQTKNEERNLKL